METDDNLVTSDQEEFLKQFRTSGIQTLITGVWQSDPVEFHEVSAILNAWFGIADSNPEVLVSKWYVMPLDIGTYSVLVELQLPSHMRKALYETDLSWLSSSGRWGQ